MKKKDIIQSIPLAMLTIISLYSMIKVAMTDYIFGVQQYTGFVLLACSIVLFFTARKIYKYFFAITLLAGLLNFIGFTVSIVTLNILGIPLQLIIIPVLIAFIYIHKAEIDSKIQGLTNKTDAQPKVENSAAIKAFKRRFEKLSDGEIESRISIKLVPEALEALKQIKKERAENNKQQQSDTEIV